MHRLLWRLFSHRGDGLFPETVETIIFRPYGDKGFSLVSSFYHRLWSLFGGGRTIDSHLESDSGDNPLPDSYEAILYYLREKGPWADKMTNLHPTYGDGPLPRSTPPTVLCLLLAFFNSVSSDRCMSLKLGHMEDLSVRYLSEGNSDGLVDPSAWATLYTNRYRGPFLA